MRGRAPRGLGLPLATWTTSDPLGSIQLETLTAGEGHVVSHPVHRSTSTAAHRVGHCRGGAGGLSL